MLKKIKIHYFKNLVMTSEKNYIGSFMLKKNNATKNLNYFLRTQKIILSYINCKMYNFSYK